MLNDIIAYEAGRLNEEGVIALFQHLVDTGQAWTLQGHYGRTAKAFDRGRTRFSEGGKVKTRIQAPRWWRSPREDDTPRFRMVSLHRAVLGTRPGSRRKGQRALELRRRRAANKVARRARRINRGKR